METHQIIEKPKKHSPPSAEPTLARHAELLPLGKSRRGRGEGTGRLPFGQLTTTSIFAELLRGKNAVGVCPKGSLAGRRGGGGAKLRRGFNTPSAVPLNTQFSFTTTKNLFLICNRHFLQTNIKIPIISITYFHCYTKSLFSFYHATFTYSNQPNFLLHKYQISVTTNSLTQKFKLLFISAISSSQKINVTKFFIPFLSIDYQNLRKSITFLLITKTSKILIILLFFFLQIFINLNKLVKTVKFS